MTTPQSAPPSGWRAVNQSLDQLSHRNRLFVYDGPGARYQHRRPGPGGIAVVTFNYGIDGVTIEIAKYLKYLEDLFKQNGRKPNIHLIGGRFLEGADACLGNGHPRHVIPRMDGWDKWDNGRWFHHLFHAPMPQGSDISRKMAGIIRHQGRLIARLLNRYMEEHGIDMLMPVNINSNPGNPAAALGVVMASEQSGCAVINSCHDFFWEGGAPPHQRSGRAGPGIRDHFFTNWDNPAFFKVLKRLHPWNGRRWHQMVINQKQMETLHHEYRIPASRLSRINTAIDDAFFKPCSQSKKNHYRLKMAHILSKGRSTVRPVSVHAFKERLHAWMTAQSPVLCSLPDARPLDMNRDNALYLLQPTRILTKKRIHRVWDLIEALFRKTDLITAFERDTRRTLTLHITGPVPLEHRGDMKKILTTFERVLFRLPGSVARRLYTAFSVGHDHHPCFDAKGMDPMSMDQIYKLADMVFLPSETEGRGLPILEAGAAGIPIMCSRYRPVETFKEVVGEGLSSRLHIRHIRFPETRFSPSLLKRVHDVLLRPETAADDINHNRKAVAKRFHFNTLTHTFSHIIDTLFHERSAHADLLYRGHKTSWRHPDLGDRGCSGLYRSRSERDGAHP